MFLIYDVETANGRNIGSICAVGWILVDHNEIVDRGYSLIDPHCKFGKYNIAVHGITQEMVQGAPTFSQYWRDCLGDKMNHAIVLSHSAGFDLSATEQALYNAGITDLGIDYVDTLEIAQAFLDSPSYKLCDLASLAGFADYQQHDPGADADALLHVLDYIRQANHYIDLESMIEDSSVPVRNTKENAFIPKANTQVMIEKRERCKETVELEDERLSGLRFCLTGDAEGHSRSEIEKMIMSHGGKATSSVSPKTNYLVVGTYADYGDGYVSSKQKKAQALIDAGANIQIIPYEKLFQMIGENEAT